MTASSTELHDRLDSLEAERLRPEPEPVEDLLARTVAVLALVFVTPPDRTAGRDWPGRAA